jgi:hypothetical protein
MGPVDCHSCLADSRRAQDRADHDGLPCREKRVESPQFLHATGEIRDIERELPGNRQDPISRLVDVHPTMDATGLDCRFGVAEERIPYVAVLVHAVIFEAVHPLWEDPGEPVNLDHETKRALMPLVGHQGRASGMCGRCQRAAAV